MNKKIIIGIVAALVVIGGTVGTVLSVQAYNTNKEYEQLAQNVADCENKINTMNYVYYEDTEGAGENARKAELDKLNGYKEKIEAKDMTDEEKTEFSDFVKSVKKHFEDDKTETKTQFDAVQASKDSHTDEGYYSDEFNNEWNGYVEQFNNLYNSEKNIEAFKVVLTMQNKLNEYTANKDRELAEAEARRQEEEAKAAAAQVKNTTSNKNGGSSSSSSKKSGGSSGSSNSDSSNSSDDGGWEYGSVRYGMSASAEDPTKTNREMAVRQFAREHGWNGDESQFHYEIYSTVDGQRVD